MKENREENWIDIVENEFEHPATILWRAIELKHLNEAIQKYNPIAPILDLGCAEGKIANILFKGKRIFGLDNCWDLIKQNNKTDTYKALILANGCYMPFKKDIFKTVFSNCVLEHIPDLDKVLAEVSRVLDKGGRFIFTVPTDKFGEYLFFYQLFSTLGVSILAKKYSTLRNRLLSHFHCYDHNVWIDKLRKNNLKVIDYSYYMSKKSTMLWDFLAGLMFIFNNIKIFGNTNRTISRFFKRQLQKYYYLNDTDGASLLVISIKE